MSKLGINILLFAAFTHLGEYVGHAQFTEISEAIGIININENVEYGNGVSFFDFNNDGWDDLTLGNGADEPLFYVNVDGVLELTDIGITVNPVAQVIMLLWADYDNDGDNDLFISQMYGPVQLWRNDGIHLFTECALETGLVQGNWRFRGAAFADYDHDGYLDLYVAKYYDLLNNTNPDHTSILYHNNGDGTFSDVTLASGTWLLPQPVFQPVFFDIDGDGWEDLYLVIDRSLWSNKVFRNNHDGTFTNVSPISGAAPFVDAMCGNVGDYDNDGDLDIYVTNGMPGNLLYQNDGTGVFTDVTSAAGVAVNLICWGSLWLDYDNDSWQDLFVGTTGNFFGPAQNQFFINQEGDTFSDGNQITNIDGDTSPTFTAAKGDINNDGYHDFVTNNNDPFPSNIWLNDGGENHFLSVALRGVYANRSGVGSWIHLYTGAEHYVRYTMCGDNFNSQNTSREIFGLGELNAIDSLVIQWNSGTVDVYYNVFADQNLLLIEGASFFVPFAMTASDDPVICIGDSLLLDAGVFEGYLWNTGDTSRYLLAYEPGEYSVLVLNHFGSWMPSDIFVLEIAEVPSLEIVLNPVSCFGEASGSIDVAADQQFLWSYFEWEGNEPGFMLGNIQAGIYYYFAQSSEGCIVNGFVEMLEPPLLELNLTTTNVSCNGGYDGSLNFVVSGGTGAVIVESSSLDFAQLSAGEYSIAVADQNGCTVEMPFAIMEPMPFLVTATATPQHENEADGSIVFQFTGGTPPYSMTDSTVFPLNDLTVSELLAGNYAFTFVDAAGCDYYIDVEIELQTNIHERTLSYVHFYPNPVDRILFSTDIKLKCQLSNMSGAFAGELNFVNGSADVSGLSQGVYCIQCKRWDGYAVFSKIVVR